MKTKVILALVLLLFLVSRIYKIAADPPSVYWDEASIGYNAYAITTDLKDEWGEFLPLHFRAFGEFKLPVYVYSVAILVKAIGLNAFSVRLPAVFYSFGTLILLYLLVKKITGEEVVALFSSFILCLSPWLFLFSRTGYEATAGLFFFILGTYLFVLIEKHRWGVLWGTLAFILSFYSYNSFRIIIPVWLAVIGAYTFRRKNLPVVALSVLIFLLSLIPVYKLYRFDNGGARFAQVAITRKSEFIKNYFSHFSPQFLFLKGDTNPRSQIPGHGQLYIFEFPLLLAGLLVILKSRKVWFYLPILALILAPIPAALTKESPHALRTILAAPAWTMIAAFGIGFFTKYFRKYAKVVVGSLIAIYLISFGMYFGDFLNKYPQTTRNDWQYQYKEIFAKQESGIVTDKYAQPYIFALYYLKYPPAKFRETVKYNPVDKWGFSLVASFNGFQFK
jgi:4-amino-4-deoxy-L-arabinose transferase-like glycosyltransferase